MDFAAWCGASYIAQLADRGKKISAGPEFFAPAIISAAQAATQSVEAGHSARLEIVWRRHLRELLGRNQRKNLQPRQSLHKLINQPPPLQRETQMRAFPNWEIGNMKNSSKRRAWSASDVRTLKSLARKKTKIGKITKALKGTRKQRGKKPSTLGFHSTLAFSRYVGGSSGSVTLSEKLGMSRLEQVGLRLPQ